jgi:LytS/YehU family sensor histidine kinase
VDIRIRVTLQSDAVLISIADQGPGMPPNFEISDGAGHGLRNVDERLRKGYGSENGLDIGENEPSGTAVTVRIPVEGGR